MKKFLFTDLGDTLFQTERKCAGAPGLEAGALRKAGSVAAFSTRTRRALLTLIGGEMTVIPATARGREAFSRVALQLSSYAILDNALAPRRQPLAAMTLEAF